MKLTIAQIGCIVLAAILLLGAGYTVIMKFSYDSKISNLNNAIAEKDKTIEIKQGLFEKATFETKRLGDLLDTKDTQIANMVTELKKKDQELIVATNLGIKWKKDYEALVKATQGTVPPVTPGNPDRIKISFEKDFGPILAKGWTLTDPPEAFVSIHQQRPLKLTLAISQDENLLWHTYVTSSEETIDAEIILSGVNPHVNDPKWYERLSAAMLVSGGANGFMGGVGLGVDISQFTVSVLVFDHSSNLLSPLYGLGVQWRPFKR